METTRQFIGEGERYTFDFKHCSADKGWAQVDTGSDAWYFGTWANPSSFEIVQWCEGDLTRMQAADAAEFVAELRRMRAYHMENSGSFGVDCMCRPTIYGALELLGALDLLHSDEEREAYATGAAFR